MSWNKMLPPAGRFAIVRWLELYAPLRRYGRLFASLVGMLAKLSVVFGPLDHVISVTSSVVARFRVTSAMTHGTVVLVSSIRCRSALFGPTKLPLVTPRSKRN